MDALARDILHVWFGEEDGDVASHASKWFEKDPTFDAELRERFGDEVVPAAAGRYAHWESSPEGALALVVLLDQFPRNIWRGSPRAFAQDATAREVTKRALACGMDRLLPPDPRRVFLYMPLMHSEHLSDHALALACFEALAGTARGGPFEEMLANNLRYEKLHADIIRRFGRYPHRNDVLGRASTPEEKAFLEQPGSSF